MTDMFGGTPTNISAMFIKENEVEIVTGVNLPMVIKLASQNKEMTLTEMAKEVEEQGKQAIYRTGELLEPHKSKKRCLRAKSKSSINSGFTPAPPLS